MPRVLRSSLRFLLIAAGALLLLAAFVVPYHVRVEPVVSQSYDCGFNNHAALLLFLGGSLLLAGGTGGWQQTPDTVDRAMPRWTLSAALLVTLFLCAAWRVDRIGKAVGSEGHYQIDRQIAMVQGARLYRDLEFIYGPLLVYPGYWVQKAAHTTPLRAYMASWFADWLLGTAMLWCMIAWLEMPTRFRVPLFLFFWVYTVLLLPSEGTHYTPLRMYCAGFFSVAVAHFWRRDRQPVRTAATMAGGVVCGFLISPEQGMALALGMSAYAVWLGWRAPERFPRRVALCVPVIAGGTAAAAKALGLLDSMGGFARGGNNFPLLPSMMNVFVLGTYVVAVGMAYRVVRCLQWDSALVPLAFCGLPLMSSALGRCDGEHLLSATPMLLVGIVWFASRPVTFVPWLVVACWLFLDFNVITVRLMGAIHKLHSASSPPGLTARSDCEVSPGVAIPQRSDYFAPFAMPIASDGTPRWNAQSGYFFGIQNVLTPEDIRRKAREIRERHAAYLLLPDLPGPPVMRFWAAEEDIRVVQAAEGSWWAPTPRRSVPSTGEVTATVEVMYAPTKFRQDGWRVWALRQGDPR